MQRKKWGKTKPHTLYHPPSTLLMRICDHRYSQFLFFFFSFLFVGLVFHHDVVIAIIAACAISLHTYTLQ